MKFNIFNIAVSVSARNIEVCSANGDRFRAKFCASVSPKMLDSKHAESKRVISGAEKRKASSSDSIAAMCDRVIARNQVVLAEPNKILFPSFVRVRLGENDLGLALSGIKANIPAIARKYGYMEPACGNGYVYSGWLGSHVDL